MFLNPQRIVCLSAEAADWLWRLGVWDQIAGVTSYFTQPQGLPSKPRISGFNTAKLTEIERLNPDLIIAFSDVQAGFAEALIKAGLPVIATNQRTLAEIEATLALLARVVDREAEAQRLLDEFRYSLQPVKPNGTAPRVYFEEWDDPLISGIAWVSELIERAGGSDIFNELRSERSASKRVISNQQVIERNPDIIFASWCGKPVKPGQICDRAGWDVINAVKNNFIQEIEGADILQPGFRLVYGYEKLKENIRNFVV
jgi:iron complex transport system substrate-binding protein